MRRPDRRSKIICTLGPSTQTDEKISQLILAGMDVARVNFSHGTHQSHKETIERVRSQSQKLNIPVAILGDLQGPKIRTGRFLHTPYPQSPKIDLKAGQRLFFKGVEPNSNPDPGLGTQECPLTISYARLGWDLKKGDSVLFDDGLVRMTVVSSFPETNSVELEVEVGKTLGENKGVNMPGAKLSTLGITEKDWDDIQFGVENQIDFFALSFVRTAREVKSLKSFLDQRQIPIHVIAKIEKAEAIENLNDILHWTDGIMVARGDLGVEVGNENVPILQKKIIQYARAAGKPVITATQMLMSMVQNPTPSRAEASDVANAVIDGTDALMLSNETATGEYPIESVTTMSHIILGAETLSSRPITHANPWGSGWNDSTKLPVSEAIEAAATRLAHSMGAKALACLTRSGQAARQLAKYRPQIPIFAFAENKKVRHQLCLCWGVSVIPWREMTSQDYTLFDTLVAELGRLGFLKEGDYSVLTAGIPTTRQVGTTNTIVVKKYSSQNEEKR
jgi:pyruvate kinase